MKKQKLISCLLAGSMLLSVGTMGFTALPKTLAVAETDRKNMEESLERAVLSPIVLTNRWYNCMVEYIWTNPNADSEMQFSNNGIQYTMTSDVPVVREFGVPPIDTSKVSLTYKFARAYSYGVGYSTATQAIEQDIWNIIINMTAGGNVIATAWDGAHNVWAHGLSSSTTIKATIAYNGAAEDLEVIVPLLGYNYSETVEFQSAFGSVTFQLRCGPNRVSIKANKEVVCNMTTTRFAFGYSPSV